MNKVALDVPFRLRNPCYGVCKVSQGNIRSTCMREGGGARGSLGTPPHPRLPLFPFRGVATGNIIPPQGAMMLGAIPSSPVVPLCTF